MKFNFLNSRFFSILSFGFLLTTNTTFGQEYEPYSVPEFLQARGYQDRDPTFDVIERNIAPGVVHHFEYQKDKPISINTVTIDLSQKDLSLEAEKGQEKLTSRETVWATSTRLNEQYPESRTIMAINADFWGAHDMMINLMVDEGVIWRSPFRTEKGFNRPVFSRDTNGKINIGNPDFSITLKNTKSEDTLTFDAVNTPHPGLRAFTWVYDFDIPTEMGTEQGILTLDEPEFIPNKSVTGSFEIISSEENISLEKGQILLTYDEEFPEWFQDGSKLEIHAKLGGHDAPVYMAVGGGPMLLHNGEILTADDAAKQSISTSFVTVRHPRTAVGVKENGEVVFVTVDGRQAGRSIGVSLFELAQIMVERGCLEAMNLDGGGSTSLLLRDEVINFPSNIYGLRPVSNSVVLKRNAPIEEMSDVRIRPQFIRALPNALHTFEILPLDKGGETTTFPENYEVQQILPEGFQKNWFGQEGKAAELDVNFAEKPGNYELEIAVATSEGTIAFDKVQVEIAELAELTIDESVQNLEKGKTKFLNIEMFDSNGKEITFRATGYRITVPKFLTFISGNESLVADDYGTGEILIEVGEKDFAFPVSVGHQKKIKLDSFDAKPDPEKNAIKGVRFNKDKSSVSLDPFNIKEGTGSWKFHYGMSGQGGGTAKITLGIDQEFPSSAYGVGFWLYGDGDGHWMRSEWRDAHNQKHVLDITDQTTGISWDGEWQWVESDFENFQQLGEHQEKAEGPFTLENIYIVETKDKNKTDGEVVIDELTALVVESP